MVKVRVVQYNLLTPHYAEKEDYFRNSIQDLDPEWRFQTILKKLSQEMKDHEAILCLQEVCQTWASRLVAWFEERDYHFVYRLYGVPKSGYMGVGIAYPRSKYRLKESHVKRVVDVVDWSKYPKPVVKEEPYWQWFFRSVFGNNPQRTEKEAEDVLRRVQSRYNATVILHLCPIESSFFHDESFAVATYHMPCDFRSPDAMTLHALLLAGNLPTNVPVILAGDFNFKPADDAYLTLTTASLKKDLGGDDKRVFQVAQDVMTGSFARFTSAYNAVDHKEPEFTIHSHTAWGEGVEFKATLDYIFTRHCKVLDVRSLQNVSSSALFPSAREEEPSDHLMLAATIQI